MIFQKFIFKKAASQIVIIFLLTGCLAKTDGTTGGNPLQVVTGFVVTGSSKATTVAKNLMNQIYGLLFPMAYANPAPVMQDASGRTVLLNKAWIAFVDVEFKSEQLFVPGEQPENMNFPGPFYVNLLDAAPVPLAVGLIDFKSYRRVQATLYKQGPMPADAPAEMLGYSVYLEGTINGVAFSFRSEETNAFVVAGPNGIQPNGTSSLLLSFYFANLFKKIDLSALTIPTVIDGSNKIPTMNPCPAIKSGASDLYECFREGLQTETNLGVDENGNSELDTNESSVD